MSPYRVEFLRCFFGICVTCYSLVRFVDCNPVSDNCFSPPGTDCDWYSRCFETGLKQCGAEANFSGQFCRLWETNHEALSEEGRRWIDRVRLCQQTALVPLLKQDHESNTCEAVRDQISTTQTDCYVSPSPSVCDLSLMDYFKLFIHTVMNSITSDSVCEAYDVLQICKEQWLPTRPCLRTVVIDIKIAYVVSRFGRGLSITSKLADTISSFLVMKADWARWMKCASKVLDARDSNLMAILMVIPDHINCISNLIGRSKRAVSSMEAVFHQLENGVRSGSLVFEVEGEKAYVSAIYLCDSPECRNATLSVIFDPRELPRSVSVQELLLPGLVLLIIIVCAVLFILFRTRTIKTAEEIPIMQSNDSVI